MKIQSLEWGIDRQNEQITAITEQLQTVMNQAQSLAMKEITLEQAKSQAKTK
ncbi:MAG: hypothetical protein LH474_05605 [Chamaesiphon sp.]|nr:hypothetical protein [Chamaesiphon sp.]